MPTPSTKRAMCERCLRAQSACICRWITPVASAVDVLILQHPLEVANAKGSARLLHLCLPGSSMATAEAFDDAALHAMLHGGGRRPVLLYPETPGDQSLGMPAPPPLPAPLLEDASALRLVVLDGTWRKSRKMLYANPLLQALPRLPLSGMAPSHYIIRKAHAPDQLSTLEASCLALAQLEREPGKFQVILAAFDGFVAQQAAYVPAPAA
jgi:DTW domain-containing protein YfiP